jgi:uncharacterized iron-regulated protein
VKDNEQTIEGRGQKAEDRISLPFIRCTLPSASRLLPSIICLLPLALCLLSPWPALAQQVVSPGQGDRSIPGQYSTLDTLFTDLVQVDVVYLGETHDSQADHQAQLQIIQELHRRHPQIAIGMEMFQRPFQDVIDAYLRGDISEDELRQQSQYDRRWGFPWESYAPILRFAQANQLPVLALNTPTEVSRRAARKGLDLLPERDRQWIPPISDIQVGSDAYRQFLRPIYDDFHSDVGTSDTFETFFVTQVLWDETMAEGVANFLIANPGYQVVVLAGQGHIVYSYGIPSRVARRMQNNAQFAQRSLLLNPSDETQNTTGEGAIADYFWFNQ